MRILVVFPPVLRFCSEVYIYIYIYIYICVCVCVCVYIIYSCDSKAFLYIFFFSAEKLNDHNDFVVKITLIQIFLDLLYSLNKCMYP